jgi:glutamate racemase
MAARPSAAAPIGVFDSGIGGLTVLRALAAEFPGEQFVYLGDTARLPYGTKTAETVVRYSLQASEALLDFGVKCIVVACNTASAVGLEAIRERAAGLPVIGVIEPGAEAACAATRAHIAVIATERTVSGGAYQEAILRRRPDVRISARATPLFVALAEEGLTQGPVAASVARHYLATLFAAQDAGAVPPDTLVLGCTHFPILTEIIRSVIGPDVRIVDSAATTARAVRNELTMRGIASASDTGHVQFVATDGIERFARVGGSFLGRPIAPAEITLIDL